MHGISWADKLNGRQRAVYSIATVVGLVIASAMFFSLKTTTSVGVPYDCGPAAYALFAGPVGQTREHGDCRTEAGQRLTTVSGLVALVYIGAQIGSRLTRTPPALRLREQLEAGTVVESTRRGGGMAPPGGTITGQQRASVPNRPIRWWW